MNTTTLHHIFLEELGDIYDAEQQVLKALPDMIAEATDEDLRSSLEDHLDETKNQVDRLKEIADQMDITIPTKTCDAMSGILSEGQKMLQKDTTTEIKDVLITLAGMRVEHYEMAAYTGIITLANTLEYSDAESLLQETLDEENNAADTLESAAQGGLFSSGLVQDAADDDDDSM